MNGVAYKLAAMFERFGILWLAEGREVKPTSSMIQAELDELLAQMREDDEVLWADNGGRKLRLERTCPGDADLFLTVNLGKYATLTEAGG